MIISTHRAQQPRSGCHQKYFRGSDVGESSTHIDPEILHTSR